MSVTKSFFVLGIIFFPSIAVIYGQFTTCTYGDVRLVDGSDSSEGRVEICINDEWGTVCDDSWSGNDAEVVCRQTGNSGGTATALSSAHFGQGTGPIWLDDVFCTGSESELLDCSNDGIGVHDCRHSEDASVRCSPLSTGAVVGIVIGSIAGFLCCVCTPIIICLVIFCCVTNITNTSRTRTVRTVTQPSVTTVATASTTQHVQQQHPSGYSAYPSTGAQYPPGGVYTDPGYPPQNNPAYPYPVQSAPYPTSDPYPQPQSSQLQVQAPPSYDDLAKTSNPPYY